MLPSVIVIARTGIQRAVDLVNGNRGIQFREDFGNRTQEFMRIYCITGTPTQNLINVAFNFLAAFGRRKGDFSKRLSAAGPIYGFIMRR
jgi:hypothetical protein